MRKSPVKILSVIEEKISKKMENICDLRNGYFVMFIIRDRPFNLEGGGLWFFVSFRNFFSDNTRVRIFILFCRAKREFFFQNLTLDFVTNTLNQIILFFLHQNQNIFLEKKTYPPPFKLNGRSLMKY